MYDRKIIEDSYPLILTDPKAANDFFREVEKMVRQLIFISRKTSGLMSVFYAYHSRDDFDDLIQEILTALWERIQSGVFNGTDRIEGYVLGIAKFQLLIFFRKDKIDLANDYYEVDEDSVKGKQVVGDEDVKVSFSEEELERIAKNYGRDFSKVVNKEVSQFSRNYVFVASYKNMVEASRKTGIDITAISRCCRHQRKSAGGYIWLYSDDEICQLFEF